MWKDPVKKRFYWAPMEKEFERLLFELVKAEEEEDAGIYLLKLHHEHASASLPFSKKESREILRLLDILIDDSRRHQKELQTIIAKLERCKEKLP